VDVRCPAGSIRPLDACAPCAPMENAHYTAENSCAHFCCNAGYYFSSGWPYANACVRRPDDCRPVVGAYYVPEYPMCTVGTLPCGQCPAIEEAVSVAVVANQCIYTCKPGYVGDKCQPCPHGSFANASLHCENCSFGYYAPKYASTSYSICPRGTMGDGGGGCVICASGKYFHDDSEAETCRNGFYRPTPWSECQVCAAGSVIVGDDCIACPPGKFSSSFVSTPAKIANETAEAAEAACTPCMVYEATACLQCTLEACGCREGSA
jgi:hypothetical protein